MRDVSSGHDAGAGDRAGAVVDAALVDWSLPVTWAEPDPARRRALALALARMPFLRPRERLELLLSHTLERFAGASLSSLGRHLGRRRGWRDTAHPSPEHFVRCGEQDGNYLTAGTAKCTFLWEPAYPGALREIYDPPAVVFYRGRLPASGATLIAMVGTRRPTGTGRQTAFRLACELADCGLATVSGLARGIDLEAHRGSVAAGRRSLPCATVAVLGCGIDRVYPRSSSAVAREILRYGCVMSEYGPGTGALKHHFPLRNRIIAGMSRGVVVVEAPEHSGALITASIAHEEGREVMVPAATLETTRGAGVRWLAQEGAPMIATATELLDELGLVSGPVAEGAVSLPEADHRAVGAWLAGQFRRELAGTLRVGDGGTAVTTAMAVDGSRGT